MNNKSILITGASAGFGAATAIAFAKQGARLFLGARRTAKLAQIAETAKSAGASEVYFWHLDVTQTSSVEAFMAEMKHLTDRLDVLVNNAGGAKGLEPIAQGLDADWEFMLQANVLGLLRVTRSALPLMTHNPGSVIVNIGSVAGRTAYEGGAAYCAAKAGELMISKALRLELCGTGVRVCTVDPGLAETEFSLVRFKGDADKAKKVYAGMTPLTAEDVAEAILWVATRPPHVCIDEMVIKPTAQAAIHKVHRASQS